MLVLELEWRRDMDPRPEAILDPALVPNLTTLISHNFDTTMCLLQGHSVRHLDWVPDLDDPMDAEMLSTIHGNQSFVHALQRLETMSIGGYFQAPKFGIFTSFLTGLRALHFTNQQVLFALIFHISLLHLVTEGRKLPRSPVPPQTAISSHIQLGRDSERKYGIGPNSRDPL